MQAPLALRHNTQRNGKPADGCFEQHREKLSSSQTAFKSNFMGRASTRLVLWRWKWKHRDLALLFIRPSEDL